MNLIDPPIIRSISSFRLNPKKIDDVLSELDKDPILDEAIGLDEVDRYDDEEDEDDEDIDDDSKFNKRWYPD